MQGGEKLSLDKIRPLVGGPPRKCFGTMCLCAGHHLGGLRYLYRSWYSASVPDRPAKRVPAIFYRTAAGGEPVREWLRRLSRDDRKLIGYDIQTVEFGWPIGMPVCRPLEGGIHEVRTNLTQNRIARVLFYVDKLNRAVLLHAFIKKTERTPVMDLQLANANKKRHEEGLS